MKWSSWSAVVLIVSCSSCATKTVCANGSEPFRPVLDPAASCTVRIRQVIVGSEIKIPASISLDGDSVNWSYGWVESEYKDGQIVLGHLTMKPEPQSLNLEKK